MISSLTDQSLPDRLMDNKGLHQHPQRLWHLGMKILLLGLQLNPWFNTMPASILVR